jgi:hypothetical protein
MELREKARIICEEQEEVECHNQSETDEEIIEVIDGKATDISNQILVENIAEVEEEKKEDAEKKTKKQTVLESEEKIPYTPHSRRGII